MLYYEYISSDHTELIQNFFCEDAAIVEEFLKEEALKLHVLQTAITRLYFDEHQNLVGFFTLYNDHVRVIKNHREKYDWALPNGYNFFPAIKIHYLGIDHRFRKLGYGEFLLSEVMAISTKISEMTGCNFITLESLKNSKGFYDKYEFRRVGVNDGLVTMYFKLGEIE
jgi:ribosomal protein S18 acetylase RimI-like enzyme